jgi:hypothetical protein
MKRKLTILLVILSLFAIYSCGKNDSATTSGSTFTLKGSGT